MGAFHCSFKFVCLYRHVFILVVVIVLVLEPCTVMAVVDFVVVGEEC